jgi:pectate lyase
MKGLAVTAKTLSNIFLLLAILISLFLGSYTFLVSDKQATLPKTDKTFEGAKFSVPSKSSSGGSKHSDSDAKYASSNKAKNESKNTASNKPDPIPSTISTKKPSPVEITHTVYTPPTVVGDPTAMKLFNEQRPKPIIL